MKKRYSILGITTIMVIFTIIGVSVGCSVNQDEFDVFGKTELMEETESAAYLINNVDDIKNIVTDDDKLVINYYDAYTWIVEFDENDFPQNMVYVYRFDNAKTAKEMLSVRCNELQQNRSMIIKSSRVINEYVVVELRDTSFNKVSRDTLEHNFDGLIVY